MMYDDTVNELLLTELIGLYTLKDWINKNNFDLDRKVRMDELQKVYDLEREIRDLQEGRDHLKFKDVIKYYGRAEQMQKEYLHEYEPASFKFPNYKSNVAF